MIKLLCIILCFNFSNCTASENIVIDGEKTNNNTNGNLLECNNFPCCNSDTSNIFKDRTKSYYDYNFVINQISQPELLQRFAEIIEAAYINYLYIQFMEQILLLRYRNDEKNNNNPKFYFYHALELLKKNSLAEAKIYLDRFISVDIESSYKIECDKYDVNWMNQRESLSSYKIAEVLRDVVGVGGLSNNQSYHSIKISLDELKTNNNEIGLIENIEFIFLRLFNGSYEDFLELLGNNEKKLLTSSLDGFDDPKEWYFLSTQLDILVYKKFIIAQDLLDEFNWGNNDIKNGTFIIYPNQIKSFFLFYDLKRKLFGENDTILLNRINSLMLMDDYHNYPMRKQIISLINFYNRISVLNDHNFQSKQYLNLSSSIREKRFKELEFSLKNLNNLYNEKGHSDLSSLDSAMIFLYQVELINSELLEMIPRLYHNTNSVFPMLDTTFVKEIKHFMRIESSKISFLSHWGNEFSRKKELFYYTESEPWKNIGYGFFSLNEISETRSLDQYFDPGNNDRNSGTEPFYNSFRIYKSLIENPGQNMFTPGQNEN